ncbi:G patch domain-containing protein 4 [Pimephales promelas]|uniref:G patch domain-containing protein 4 n=1 Tax=Pimephales promelas TaxID=90988 RepID=UPI001955D221|nr:G patch domain-containing protein 4 [Pimephales promelas]KAG1947940.1 G patch domain-containing protein [Pimephales promelas]
MDKEKSTGLKFAEEQLLRHGWEKGKGLGRSENGISEAIKVKIKYGKGGMGHKEGEQFSFHWWDHVFNKASSSLVVEAAQTGVVVTKSTDSSDGLISNKKPRKAQQAKSMLYGCFVKSATLLSGEQPEKTSDSDDSSSSEDEDQKLDLSTTTKLSDADLLKACGGRTAHKGARHGLTMSAKLARLEQQEQEFLNKYGKKNHTAETSTSSTDRLNPVGHSDIKEKTKRKKSKRQDGPSENNIHEDEMETQVLVSSNDTEDSKPQKRKDSNGVSMNDDIITDVEPKKKRKKNRKEKEAPEDGLNGECSVDVNEVFTHASEEREAHRPMDDSIHKKKKKKKRSKVVAETAGTDEIFEYSTDAHGKQPQEGSIEHQQTSGNVSKKKKKSVMDLYETSPSADVENSTGVMTATEDTGNEAQITGGQENKKRSKKRKRNKKEQEEVVENVQCEESTPKKKKSKK